MYKKCDGPDILTLVNVVICCSVLTLPGVHAHQTYWSIQALLASYITLYIQNGHVSTYDIHNVHNYYAIISINTEAANTLFEICMIKTWSFAENLLYKPLD